MATRTYPQNAPRGGSFALAGAGSANDILTFAIPSQVVVQNGTAATIYVASGSGPASAATRGDLGIPAGGIYNAQAEGIDELSTWLAIYGVAATPVNGTTTGGIVIYGVQS